MSSRSKSSSSRQSVPARRRWRRLGATLAVLGAFVVVPLSHAIENVALRGGDHEDYARIAFEWPQAVDFSATVEGRV